MRRLELVEMLLCCQEMTVSNVVVELPRLQLLLTVLVSPYQLRSLVCSGLMPPVVNESSVDVAFHFSALVGARADVPARRYFGRVDG